MSVRSMADSTLHYTSNRLSPSGKQWDLSWMDSAVEAVVALSELARVTV